MNFVKQTDFKYIPAEGCLFFSILAGVQRYFGEVLTFDQCAYAYKHLLDQSHIREDCFVLDHAEVGNVACSLLIQPDYKVVYVGKKDLVKPSDSWGVTHYGTGFTVLHGITKTGGHHFRLGDQNGVQAYDPFDPPPGIIGEASIRFYKVQKIKNNTPPDYLEAVIPVGVVG